MFGQKSSWEVFIQQMQEIAAETEDFTLPHIDHLTVIRAHLDSYDTRRNMAYFVQFFFLSIITSLFCCYYYRIYLRGRCIIASCSNPEHLRVLSLVGLTPGRGPAIRHACNTRYRRITLSPSALLDDIASGDINVHPATALPALFIPILSHKSFNGWEVSLDMTPSGLTVWWWMLKQRLGFSPSPDAACYSIHDYKPDHIQSWDDTQLSLDSVPRSRIKAEIAKALGSSSTIEFTSSLATNGARVFLLCAFPLANRPRSQIPLFVSLDDVLNIVRPLAHIESVEEVSKDYSNVLGMVERNLESDTAERFKFIEDFGHAAWRRERFLLAWERSLFDVGLMNRWMITVKPTKTKSIHD